MIILDEKKPIPMNHIIHSVNHIQYDRGCIISKSHTYEIKKLEYELGKVQYNVRAGLYRIDIDGVEYIIDVFYNLTDADHFIIYDKYNIFMVRGDIYYPVIPYKVLSTQNNLKQYNITNSLNDNVSMIMIVGKTTTLLEPALDHPCQIIRLSNFDFSSSGTGVSTLEFGFKYGLGCMPNGAKDLFVLNAEQLECHVVMNTNKEILSGGLNWQLQEEYVTDDHYVFFAKYDNIADNIYGTSLRCTHLPTMGLETLLDKNTKINCISTSGPRHEHGLWIKLAKSVLNIHGDKNISNEFCMWVAKMASSNNPIYIEYEINGTKYINFTIDEYHLKTFYPKTFIKSNNGCEFSVFYKGLF